MSTKKNNPAKGTKEDYREIVLRMFNSKNEIIDTEEQEETKPIDELTKKWNMNEKIVSLFTENITKDQKLRGKYAIILICFLAFELVALLVIFILRGCNVLNYSDSSLNIFITGGLAEIFILIRVIVKYLFKDNLTNALNIILENNNKIRQKRNISQKK